MQIIKLGNTAVTISTVLMSLVHQGAGLQSPFLYKRVLELKYINSNKLDTLIHNYYMCIPVVADVIEEGVLGSVLVSLN